MPKIVLFVSLFFLSFSGACAGHRYPAVRSAQVPTIVEQRVVAPSAAEAPSKSTAQDHPVSAAPANIAGTRSAMSASVVWPEDGTKPVLRNRVRTDRREKRSKNTPIVAAKKPGGKRLVAVRTAEKNVYKDSFPRHFSETMNAKAVLRARDVPEKPVEYSDADLLAVLNASSPEAPRVSDSISPPLLSLTKAPTRHTADAVQEKKNAPSPSSDAPQRLFVPLEVGSSFNRLLRIFLPLIAAVVFLGFCAGYVLSRRLRRTPSFDENVGDAVSASGSTAPLAAAHSAPDAVPIVQGQGEKVPARSDTGDNNAAGETVSLN